MYAKLILRFQCYRVKFGMLCHLQIFVVRSFLPRKPGRGAQRQVSMTYGLLMSDVHIWCAYFRCVSLYDHKI
jgi:hypothetical protein